MTISGDSLEQMGTIVVSIEPGEEGDAFYSDAEPHTVARPAVGVVHENKKKFVVPDLTLPSSSEMLTNEDSAVV